MKLGDTIITNDGSKYIIDEFITIKDEQAVNLKALNGVGRDFRVMKCYLNYYIGNGIYTIKRKNNTIKKLKRRHHSRKLRGKRS